MRGKIAAFPVKIAHDPGVGPEVRDWGARELGLRDPNGYYLTFTEAAKPGESPP